MPETQNCILVVDDDKRMRKAVMDFLATGGYRMLAAGDGEEAWDSFQKKQRKHRSDSFGYYDAGKRWNGCIKKNTDGIRDTGHFVDGKG